MHHSYSMLVVMPINAPSLCKPGAALATLRLALSNGSKIAKPVIFHEQNSHRYNSFVRALSLLHVAKG